ncbi:GNAT family N-acetyltransferase [Sansalvadorimonas sp. 2012CJ34-2]|uniref:GNAT family N-acetyltransferase n=1 Tax=Parendozoicomonas callyspongiae TaxID=2942213 RepID=A0ABT0PBD6_9GAMM|nr:GNAT family N-acetyltransferase [Sansalvadorimonas sp. 2012CJ34-2]MCL6268346.1 GNAT family N-acetyltransferase [Sansalvadorimonas sp. 2012CJ34-2]
MSQKMLIRNVWDDEFELLTEWFAKADWNPGLADIKVACKSKTGLFYIGVLDGKPVACLSAHIYEYSFAFIGYFHIADPELRGKGYGYQIWKHVFEDLNRIGVRLMGLDADPLRLHKYRKHGFEESHYNRRYHYRVKGSEQLRDRVVTRPPESMELTAFDAHYVKESRGCFIHQWLDLDVGRRHLCMRNSRGQLRGYGVLREAAEGYRVGPLYAQTVVDAKDLMEGLCCQLYAGTSVYIDIPDNNLNRRKFINHFKLEPTGHEWVRMYYGKPPEIPTDEVYGVCSVEMG